MPELNRQELEKLINRVRYLLGRIENLSAGGEIYTLAEKNKLAAIEANAKDDQTASEVPIVDTAGNYVSTEVEGALAEIALMFSGLAHTAITAIDLKPTGMANEFTVEISWTDENGTPQTTTDPTPITLSGDNIFTADGALTGDRTITMGSFELRFSGSGPVPTEIRPTGEIIAPALNEFSRLVTYPGGVEIFDFREATNYNFTVANNTTGNASVSFSGANLGNKMTVVFRNLDTIPRTINYASVTINDLAGNPVPSITLAAGETRFIQFGFIGGSTAIDLTTQVPVSTYSETLLAQGSTTTQTGTEILTLLNGESWSSIRANYDVIYCECIAVLTGGHLVSGILRTASTSVDNTFRFFEQDSGASFAIEIVGIQAGSTVQVSNANNNHSNFRMYGINY